MAEAELQQRLAAASDAAPAEAAAALQGIISSSEPSTAEVVKVKEQVVAIHLCRLAVSTVACAGSLKLCNRRAQSTLEQARKEPALHQLAHSSAQALKKTRRARRPSRSSATCTRSRRTRRRSGNC